MNIFQEDLKTMELDEALQKHDLTLKDAFENSLFASKVPKNRQTFDMANYRIEDNSIIRCSEYSEDFIAKYPTLKEAETNLEYLKLVMPSKSFSNVYKGRNRFEVRKSMDGKDVYFGSYRFCEQAILVVEELKKNDWDKNKLKKILFSLAIERNSLRGRPVSKRKGEEDFKYYIRTDSGRFRIIKTVNGKTTYFGTYDKEDDAKRIVEELKKNSWDKNKLKDILEELGV